VLIELDPVDRLTADAVGAPGERVFYLQARKGDQVVTLLVEKQQVQLLAASVIEILSRVGKETGQGPPDEAMGLEDPVVPEWRAGRLSIGYQEERDLLVLEVEEVLPEDQDVEDAEEADLAPDEDGEEAEGEDVEEHDLSGLEAELESELGAGFDRVLAEDAQAGGGGLVANLERAADSNRARFWATREQMLSLARHGAAVCAAGRPRCPLCGNPMDPEGHRCPALNGHREESST
jgi:uncharacterized repeat protein (TIGR03847 family)